MKLKKNQPAIGVPGAPCNMRRPDTLARAARAALPHRAGLRGKAEASTITIHLARHQGV
jgi:hypothetical protein